MASRHDLVSLFIAGLLLAACRQTERAEGPCQSPIEAEVRRSLLQIGASRPSHSAVTDVTFPGDADQMRGMGKTAILAVTVFSRDEADLPIESVYAVNQPTSGRPTISVLPAVSNPTKVLTVPKDSESATLFGSYRQDGFYLVPMRLLWSKGQIGIRLRRDGSTLPLIQLPIPQERPSFAVGPGLETTVLGEEQKVDLGLIKALVEKQYCVRI